MKLVDNRNGFCRERLSSCFYSMYANWLLTNTMMDPSWKSALVVSLVGVSRIKAEETCNDLMHSSDRYLALWFREDDQTANLVDVCLTISGMMNSKSCVNVHLPYEHFCRAMEFIKDSTHGPNAIKNEDNSRSSGDDSSNTEIYWFEGSKSTVFQPTSSSTGATINNPPVILRVNKSVRIIKDFDYFCQDYVRQISPEKSPFSFHIYEIDDDDSVGELRGMGLTETHILGLLTLEPAIKTIIRLRQKFSLDDMEEVLASFYANILCRDALESFQISSKDEMFLKASGCVEPLIQRMEERKCSARFLAVADKGIRVLTQNEEIIQNFLQCAASVVENKDLISLHIKLGLESKSLSGFLFERLLAAHWFKETSDTI